MEEIIELQRQLQAAQETSTSQRLSERNCIELVMKLQSLKLVDLIFTRSGKEYLTPKHLITEVEDILLTSGGRVNIIDLPDELNVSLTHVETAVHKVIKADSSNRLIRGELLTDYYLSALAEEVYDGLIASETGIEEVGAIATRYSLPVDLIRQTILQNPPESAKATYDAESGVVRSAASIARQKAVARGMLRAITSPTVLSDIAKVRGLQQKLILQIALEMLQDAQLAGRIEGRASRSLFIPKIFITAATSAVSANYTANGFISFIHLNKLHIQNIDEFARNHLSNSRMLSECVLNSLLLETVSTYASEASQQGSWLDIQSWLPLDFPESDVSKVVQLISVQESNQPRKEEKDKSRTKRRTRISKAEAAEKKTPVYGGRFIVSPELTKKVTDVIVEDSKRKAEDRAKLISEKGDVVVSQSITNPPEAEEPVASKKGKKKGRRRVGGKNDTQLKSGVSAREDVNSRFPIHVPSQDEIVELILTDAECAQALDSDYLESSQDGRELASEMVEVIFNDEGLRELYYTQAAEAIVTLQRERAAAKLTAERTLLSSLERIEMAHKSADSLSTEELVAKSKESIMNRICVDCLFQVVDSVARSCGIVFEFLSQLPKLSTKKEKLDILRSAIGKLSPILEAKLKAFIDTVSDKSSGTAKEFLDLYDEHAVLLDLPHRRPLDGKKERNALASIRAGLMNVFGDKELKVAPLKALESGVILTHAKLCGGSMISIAESDVYEFSLAVEEEAKVSESGAKIGSSLQELRIAVHGEDTKAKGMNAEGQKASDDFIEKLDKLRELLA